VDHQGCQMVYFQTKIPILGKFWLVFKWKLSVYLIVLWSVLRQFDICYGHSVYFGLVWYISPVFGMFYKVKSGNTVDHPNGRNFQTKTFNCCRSIATLPCCMWLVCLAWKQLKVTNPLLRLQRQTEI
jgi:hypothetical protein